MSGLPPKPDFAYLPPQIFRHEQHPRSSDLYTRSRNERSNPHSSRPPDTDTYIPRTLSWHRDPPGDDVYIPRLDSSRWKGPPREWETRDVHAHSRRAIPNDHNEREGTYTPRQEPSWRNGPPRDRRFRDEDRTRLVTGPYQNSCQNPRPRYYRRDRRSRSPPHHHTDECRNSSTPCHDPGSPCQSSYQSHHERSYRQRSPSSAQEYRPEVLSHSPRHHLHADLSEGSSVQNRAIESGGVRSAIELVPSQDQLSPDAILRAPTSVESPPAQDKGKKREEIVGDIGVSVEEARSSYLGPSHPSMGPHTLTNFNASTVSNCSHFCRLEMQQMRKTRSQTWFAQVQDARVDSSQTFVPVPAYQPRVPGTTSLNDPKLAEMSTLQNRRVSLLANYFELIKAAHRAQYDCDMGLIDVLAVEQRRLIAEEQEQLAKGGTLGVDFSFT